ncbi:MAG: hypothetical protein GY895_00315 [Phycisphaera sp.]|nr:hypothetical protein [Phycisphaera sp.]
MIEGVWADDSNDGSILDSFSAIVDSNPDSAPEHVWTIDGRPFDGHFIDFHDSTTRFFHAFAKSEWIFRPIPGVTSVFTDIDDSMPDFAAVTSGSHFGEEVDWTRLNMGVLNEDQFHVDLAGIVQIPIRHGDFFDLEITFAPAPARVALFMGAGLSRRRRRS